MVERLERETITEEQYKKELILWREMCQKWEVDPEKWISNTYYASGDFPPKYYVIGPPQPSESMSFAELDNQHYNGVYGQKKLNIFQKFIFFFFIH